MKNQWLFKKAFEFVDRMASKEKIKDISTRLFISSAQFMIAKKKYLECVGKLEKSNFKLTELIRVCPYYMDLEKYLNDSLKERQESLSKPDKNLLKDLIKARKNLIDVLFERLQHKKDMKAQTQ